MNEFLLVDGYNIIHAWDELKWLIDDDLDHARHKLIDMLAEYGAVKGLKAIVVFDAHLVKGGSGFIDYFNNVEVVYTTEGETADSYIERWATKLGADNRVIVATSDWTQQQIVFGKGAIRISARELGEEVRACIKDTRKDYAKKLTFDGTIRDKLDAQVKAMLEKIRRQK